MGDCNICCEPYTGKLRKKITCNHCNFECCVACAKRVILDDVNDARCMAPDCKKNWDREFLISAFSYSFVDKVYKKHRESILYDRQLSMFEETQGIIEEREESNKLNIEISEIDSKISELRKLRRQKVNERYNRQYSEHSVIKKWKEVYG